MKISSEPLLMKRKARKNSSERVKKSHLPKTARHEKSHHPAEKEKEKSKMNLGIQDSPRSRNNISILQGYTYFLNTQHSTFVTIGFSSKDFSPIAQISTQNQHFGVDSIHFNRNQWSTIYAGRETITKKMDTSGDEGDNIFGNEFFTLLKDHNIVKIDFMGFNDMRCVVFTQNHISVVLNKKEFENLMLLNDFINTSLIYNNSVQFFIREYCERYIASCKNLNVEKMDPSSYTSPMDSRPPINYFRLFSEIPFIYEKVTEITFDDQIII